MFQSMVVWLLAGMRVVKLCGLYAELVWPTMCLRLLDVVVVDAHGGER